MSIRVYSERCSIYKIDRRTFRKILPSIQKDLKMDYNNEFEKRVEKIRAATPKRIIGRQRMQPPKSERVDATMDCSEVPNFIVTSSGPIKVDLPPGEHYS